MRQRGIIVSPFRHGTRLDRQLHIDGPDIDAKFKFARITIIAIVPVSSLDRPGRTIAERTRLGFGFDNRSIHKSPPRIRPKPLPRGNPPRGRPGGTSGIPPAEATSGCFPACFAWQPRIATAPRSPSPDEDLHIHVRRLEQHHVISSWIDSYELMVEHQYLWTSPAPRHTRMDSAVSSTFEAGNRAHRFPRGPGEDQAFSVWGEAATGPKLGCPRLPGTPISFNRQHIPSGTVQRSTRLAKAHRLRLKRGSFLRPG